MLVIIAAAGIVSNLGVSPCLRMSSAFGMTLGGDARGSALTPVSIPVCVPAESVNASEGYFSEFVRIDEDGCGGILVSSHLGRRRSWMTSDLPSLPPPPVIATATLEV